MTLLARIAAAALLLAAGPAFADGGIAVSDAWARAGTPGARTGAAFMTVTNGGTESDRIVAAQSPVAEKAELHTHMMDNGVMKMRAVDAIEVSPGEPAVLRPGGLHVMLMGLKQPLTQGGHFPVTLTFAKAGAVTVDVAVQGAAAMGPAGAEAAPMNHGGMDHGAMHQQMHQQMNGQMHGTAPQPGQ
ncbi:copper chaperone PCu(A)C [Azospirillum sp. sgz302134]